MTPNLKLHELPVQESHPLIPLPDLLSALSPERLGAYSLARDHDSTDALARYLWNGALCIAVHPALHALEVTLRNNLFRASEAAVDTTGRIVGTFRCWLDAKPSFLFQHEQESVDEAISRISPNPRFHSPGRLVAKLGFGFWTALCRAPYDHSRPDGPRLWPRILPDVFPHMPKRIRTREDASTRMDSIREFRNRIAHHEPIWDRDLLNRYEDVVEAISWMYPNMAKAVRVCGDVGPIYYAGARKFRPLAERLLGVAA